MKFGAWLQKWGMSSLKITAPFLEMEFIPQDSDKNAAWELYIELLTRVATQELKSDDGNEMAALESVHSIFPLTRSIIKSNGRTCIEFTKIAVVILNQKIRPFTSKWHKVVLSDKLNTKKKKNEFREELNALQKDLRCYTAMLSEMAGVENLTTLEN